MQRCVMADKTKDFQTEKMLRGDHIVRGTAADGQIRAFAVTARDTVQAAKEAHHTSPLVTAALGRLMMSGLMMGVMFKNPGELVTLSVRGDGPIGGLTVTANTEGQVKGFANHPNVWLSPNEKGKLDVGGGIGFGSLTVIRDEPGADPYSSSVELASGEIGDDITYYFAMSEQVPTSVGVGVLVDRDTSVRQAGGFLVQLMPDCSDEVADKLEANLAQINSVTDMLEDGLLPADILRRVLDGLDFQELEAIPAEFHCGCNEDRAIRAVLALGIDELQSLVDDGEPAEVYCHFCGKRYTLPPDKLKLLLAAGVKAESQEAEEESGKATE